MSMILTFSTVSVVTLPITGIVTTLSIDWGDGSVTVGTTITHTYSPPKAPTILVVGTFTGFGTGAPWQGNTTLTAVNNWGPSLLTNLNGAFLGCTALTSVPSTLPASISLPTILYGQAALLSRPNRNPASPTPTSSVQNLNATFQGATSFNQDLRNWDVSNVTEMNAMFQGASSFIQDLTRWALAVQPSVRKTPPSNFFTDSIGRDITLSSTLSPFYINLPLVTLPQNAQITQGDSKEILKEATIYTTQLANRAKPNFLFQAPYKRAMTASTYVKFKKAQVYAQSRPSIVTVPQSSYITQLQDYGDSTSSVIRYTQSGSPPTAVQTPTHKCYSPNITTISWNPPQTIGDISIWYDISGVSPRKSIYDLSSTYLDLTIGNFYTFYITPINYFGSGPTIPLYFKVGYPPSAALTVACIVSADQTVLVTWRQPSLLGDSLSNIYYTINYYDVSAPSVISLPNRITDLSATITPLVYGTTYGFIVISHNTFGDGPPSELPNPTVNVRALPRLFQPITVRSGVDKTAFVNWSIPGVIGDKISTLTYDIRYTNITLNTPVVLLSNIIDLSATITQLINGSTYSFTVTPKNSLGSALVGQTAITRIGVVPGQPQNVSYTIPATKTAQITWAAPAIIGDVSAWYVVSTPGLPSQTVYNPTFATTFAPLVDGSAYAFTVMAVNSFGSGGFTTIQVLVGVPPGPLILSAIGASSSVIVSWPVPIPLGDISALYDISCSTGARIQTYDLSATFTGLTNGVPYSFSWTVTNRFGSVNSTMYPGSQITKKAGIVPSIPLDISGITNPDRTAFITWKPPTITGGIAITYDVSCTDTSIFYTGITDLSASFPLLNNGTRYTFTVTANNLVGPGPPATVSFVVGLPPSISALTAQRNGDKSARLLWTTNILGDVSVSYDISGSADLTFFIPFTIASSTNTSFNRSLTNLINGATYTFYVTPRNSIGTGVTQSATVKVGLPPTITASLTPTYDHNAVLSWTVSPLGDTAASYDISASNTFAPFTRGPNSVSTQQYTFTNLTDALPYVFYITPRNSFGAGTQLTFPLTITAPTISVAAINVSVSQSAIFSITLNNAVTGVLYDVSTSTDVGAQPLVIPSIPVLSQGQSFSFTPTNLTNGATYTLSIIPRSAIALGIVKTATVKVGIPPIITASLTPTFDHNAVLSWTLTTLGDYSVYYTITATGPTTLPLPALITDTVAPATHSYTFNLQDAGAYTISITPVNTISPGITSTFPITITAPAISVTASRNGDQAAIVSWSVTNGQTSGNTYTISATADLPGAVIPTTATISSLSQSFTGLTNGATYIFTVTPRNAIALGLATTATVKVGSVPVITNMTASRNGLNAAALNWTTSPIGDISAWYTISATTNVVGSVAISSQTVYSTTSLNTLTFNGLTSDTTYTFSITPMNSMFTGQQVNSSVKIISLPGQPSSIQTTGKYLKAVVQWGIPAIIGDISAWYVISYNNITTPPIYGLSTTIAGLTDGSSYVFTVTAINSFGTGGSIISPSTLVNLIIPPPQTLYNFLRAANPISTAVDSANNIYIVDTYNSNKIIKINNSGVLSIFIAYLQEPVSIVIDKQDNIYIAAFPNTIYKYDINGNVLPQPFNFPFRYLSQLALDYVGNLYALDTALNASKIIVFKDGNTLTGSLNFTAYGLALDSKNVIYTHKIMPNIQQGSIIKVNLSDFNQTTSLATTVISNLLLRPASFIIDLFDNMYWVNNGVGSAEIPRIDRIFTMPLYSPGPYPIKIDTTYRIVAHSLAVDSFNNIYLYPEDNNNAFITYLTRINI